MFSSITIASSTTQPTERVSASNVILLIEKPNAYIAAQVPITDTGTARVGMIVAETFRRKRKITMMTRQKAIASVSCTLLTAARIDIDRSNNGCIWIAAGT